MSKRDKAQHLLPAGLETLLNDYRNHCRRNGLRESSINLCTKVDRWFLLSLSVNGCTTAGHINAGQVTAACLSLQSNYYLSTVKTFLRFLAAEGYTDRDYSYIVPPYKRPQPMPSVYSTEEIHSVEIAARGFSCRDHAILLLATRLGIRSGDIATLSLRMIDFEANVIRLTQQKTEYLVELALLPEVKAALLKYINNERPRCNSHYVFLNQNPPHDHITIMLIGKIVRRNLKKAGIETDARKRGPHAFRSSLASSMVNDNIPYEVVRKTLGHLDPNAIKSYARLDVEQLRRYALPVPDSTGGFAELLYGKKVAL